MSYAEILNDEIVQVHSPLPDSYKNISNFFALTIEQLWDLSWSGNVGVRFYSYQEQMIENIPQNHVLVGPTYTIDHANHIVTGTYTTALITPESSIVPETITATQIRLWLVRNNISLEQIDSIIDSIPDLQQRSEAKIYWEYAPYVERNNPILILLANILGLTPEQIDQGFIQANNI